MAELFEHSITGVKAYAATAAEKNQLRGRGFRSMKGGPSGRRPSTPVPAPKPKPEDK